MRNNVEIKKARAENPSFVNNHKYMLGSGMTQAYIENCLAGWVQGYNESKQKWTALKEVLNDPKYLSKFGVMLGERMAAKEKDEMQHCRRKIKWLLAESDRAVGKVVTAPTYQLDKNVVKEHADLVEVISGYTELKKCGRSYKGLCPLHQEKTPSFYVRPDKGWYCHGCNKGGDVFSFVQVVEGCDFPTALRKVGGMV